MEGAEAVWAGRFCYFRFLLLLWLWLCRSGCRCCCCGRCCYGRLLRDFIGIFWRRRTTSERYVRKRYAIEQRAPSAEVRLAAVAVRYSEEMA
jgi:hypothetical protein